MSREEPAETDRLLGISLDGDEYHDAEDEFDSEDTETPDDQKRKVKSNENDDEGVEKKNDPSLGGVKPKMKKAEEVMKKRRVLKKAHSLAQVQLPFGVITDTEKSEKQLFRRMSVDTSQQAKVNPFNSPPVPKKTSEKIAENEETPQSEENVGAEEENVPGAPTRRVCPEFFGVKSYLHTFYESVSIGSPSAYEDAGESEYRYLIAPGGKRRAACLWKVAFYLGINLLAFGLVMILVGYLVPKRPMVVGHEEDMEIIDKTALNFNKNLDLCKLVGLIVFCLGGTILVAVLLFPSIVSGYCEEETAWSAEGFRVRVQGYPEDPESPTEKKIPATEELSSIQPKRETDEGKMVMTNAGLCKIP